MWICLSSIDQKRWNIKHFWYLKFKKHKPKMRQVKWASLRYVSFYLVTWTEFLSFIAANYYLYWHFLLYRRQCHHVYLSFCPESVLPAVCVRALQQESHQSEMGTISSSGWFPTMWSMNLKPAGGLQRKEDKTWIFFSESSQKNWPVTFVIFTWSTPPPCSYGFKNASVVNTQLKPVIS